MDRDELLETWKQLWGIYCPSQYKTISRGLLDEELFDFSVSAEALILLQRLRALAVSDGDSADPRINNRNAESLLTSPTEEIAKLCGFTRNRFSRCIEELSNHSDGVLAHFAGCPFLSPPRKGFIYFIKSGRGPIKIGFSVDPDQRINTLQTGSHAILIELARIPGDMALERELHKRFSHLRRSGEWFDPGSDLISFIGKLSGDKNVK